MFKFHEAPSHSSNYVKGILDEIALEGLYGIAPNDLWLRINDRPYFPIKAQDECSKSFLWEAVKRLRSVSFYELPEARPPLVLFDRFEHIDPEIGVIIEPENMPESIYPHCKVDDPAAGIVGSCTTYYTRVDVTDQVRLLTYQDVVEKWGHKLVAVASQTARRNALQNSDINPNLELTAMQYLVLERVGRTRYHGEITQGRDSLQTMGEDAKTIFYLRKVLQKHRLITKQMFHQKLGTQNACGLLLHLPRFFVERRPKALALTEKVLLYLKNKPNYMEEYSVLRQDPELTTALKKLSKTLHFQKFIKSDLVPYRTVYPEATESEWRYKGANKERSVRVLYLIDGSTNPKDVWQKYIDIYDDEEDDRCGLLDESHRLLDRTLLAQAYSVLEAKGPAGAAQVELGGALGLSKLAARMLVRNISKSDKVSTFMHDEGRQRTAMFTLTKFDKCSDMKKQMGLETDKHLKLVVGSKVSQNPDPSDKQRTKKSIKVNKKTNTTRSSDKPILPPNQENSMEMEVDTIKETGLPGNDSAIEKVIEKFKNETHKSSEVTITEIDKKKERKRKQVMSKGGFKTEVNDVPKIKKMKSSEEKPTILESSKTYLTAKEENQEEFPEKEEIKLEISVPDLSKLQRRRGVKQATALSSDIKNDSSLSFRLLKRTNLIMETVQKQKVVFDMSKLQKMIYEEEMKEGYDCRMDKKSLLRIINQLKVEGHLKYLEITLRGYGKVKTLTFICHPSVTTDHSVIQSAVDQAKMKFHTLGKEAIKKKTRLKQKQKTIVTAAKAAAEKNSDVHTVMIPITDDDSIGVKYNCRVGRVYGFKPKYMRLQVLHKYIYYLIYGYDGDESLDQSQAKADLAACANVSEDVKAEMSLIYKTSMDWKMFIPPLPEHNGYCEGWALMSDVLLRIPLSIFIQIVNVMYDLPEIQDYINHPIRKHYLLKNLPMHLRKVLTFARKYIFAVHEQVVRLCCTGLVQMGPQRLKEKDQVFIFLNRHAVLWDTTSSPVGYHQIAKDKTYPIHHFHFRTMADVDQYWYDLWNFCMHTMLGGRMCMDGKEVVVEGVQTKPEMLEAVEARNVEEAPAQDTGYMPGDHLGAAGFDSAMFAHLKRNWYWNSTKTNLGGLSSSAPVPSTELQPLKPVIKQKEERKLSSKPVRVILETSSARRRVTGRRCEQRAKENNQRQSKRQLNTKRTVRLMQLQRRASRKPYYDQVDREALLKMSKLRVEWKDREDNLLLLCKVATLIFQHIGKRYLNLLIVREILHDQFPEATDKTSRACQRRLNYMMKNTQTQRSVHLCVEEMKQDKILMSKLKDLMEEVNREGKAQESDVQWANSYRSLVLLLQERYKRLSSQDLSRQCEGFLLPDTTEELMNDYKIIRPQKQRTKRGFSDIKNITDIEVGVINSTILSALNSLMDKTSWTYQLFSIYQQYPDKLLRSVMAKTRADQMVSLRKRYLRTHARSGDYLPLSSSPYQISVRYINLLMTRYKSEVYGDCLTMYQKLASNANRVDPYMEIVAANGGIAACIVELFTNNKIAFKLDIPDQVIVMDPNVEKDETYSRIVARYHDILSKSKDGEQFLDERNIAQSTDDPEDTECRQQQATQVKAASRIALFLSREKDDMKPVDQQELQHAHDFFVFNATRVFCGFYKNKFDRKGDTTNLLPLPEDTVNKLINKLKRLAIFPEVIDFDPDVTSVVTSELGESQEFVDNLMEFIRDKKEIGATVADIREVYGTDRRVMRVLEAMCECQALVYCGVTQSHWVHRNSYSPWVIRSYKMPRLQKENTVHPDVVRGLIYNVGQMSENDIQVDKIPEKKGQKLYGNPTECTTSLESPSLSFPPPLSPHQPHTSSSKSLAPHQDNCFVSNLSCLSASLSLVSTNNNSSILPPTPSTSSCPSPPPPTLSPSSCPSPPPPILSTSSCASPPPPSPTTSICPYPPPPTLSISSCPSPLHSIPSTSSNPFPPLPIPSTSGCPSRNLSVRNRKPTTRAGDHISDNTDQKPTSKCLNVHRQKFKKTSFDPKTKCNLNVVIRPWIRINGAINRRVLCKFLTSVLGHIMTFPLCSLNMVQERFTPAFQPHHTRELVEMLTELKCIRMLAMKHSHKPSLFSEPTIVSTVVASGLEREEEIILDPDPMAVTNLSGFIGDGAFLKDMYHKKE